jgi:hypothetical protein
MCRRDRRPSVAASALQTKEGTMSGAFKRGAALLAASAATALGAAAPASAAVTVTVPATADLTARLLVVVPVTVTCGPYEVTPPFASLNVQLSQAVKKHIATGQVFFGMGTAFLTCDGVPHTYTANVMANASGPPFNKGNALITATAFASGSPPDQGAAGPQVIRLR